MPNRSKKNHARTGGPTGRPKKACTYCAGRFTCVWISDEPSNGPCERCANMQKRSKWHPCEYILKDAIGHESGRERWIPVDPFAGSDKPKTFTPEKWEHQRWVDGEWAFTEHEYHRAEGDHQQREGEEQVNSLGTAQAGRFVPGRRVAGEGVSVFE